MNTQKQYEPSLVYLCIHKRLDDKVGITRCISIENILIMLGQVYHIPKELRKKVLKELEDQNIFQRREDKFVEIMPFKNNLI